MSFELPSLPYAIDALEPYVSAKTLELHHGRHHQAYVDKLNKAIEGTSMEKSDLETLVQTQTGGIFNNAAQTWNHSFYWLCMKPDGGGSPRGALAEAIERDIGSLNDFKQQMAEAATSEFGSGWAWLVVGADGKLHILSTTDAHSPISQFQAPLLTLDMWEHAYYVDYHNEKDKYVGAYLDHLLNWEFAQENFSDWTANRKAA